jgi:putative DNA primase/helicase
MIDLLPELDIPAQMANLPNWVLWRSEIRNDRPTKIPYSTNGHCAKSNDPGTWSTLDAVRQQAHNYTGIGFQLGVEPCGIIAVDLDHCLIDGEVEGWARNVLAAFRSYTELSPSRQGFHVFFSGKLPGKSTKKGKIEIYDRLRYMTVTQYRDTDYCFPFRTIS